MVDLFVTQKHLNLMDDFVSQFLTLRLFHILDRDPDRLRFKWWRMPFVVDTHRGIHHTANIFMSQTYINIELIQDLQTLNPNIRDREMYEATNNVADDFIFTMNQKYNFIGVEVGIYKLITSPVLHDPATFVPRSRIMYRIAPYNFTSHLTPDQKRYCGNPKKFKLHNNEFDI